MMPSTERHGLGRWWVPIVLAVGAAAGFGLSLLPSPEPIFPGRPIHVLLSAVIVALLVALLVVYAKVYADTRARFSLGLLVILALLLFETLLVFPPLLGPFGLGEERPFHLLPFSDLLAVGAYAVFLYLSLE
jgi:hypothetical protein